VDLLLPGEEIKEIAVHAQKPTEPFGPLRHGKVAISPTPGSLRDCSG
jgi:hypothetical protein